MTTGTLASTPSLQRITLLGSTGSIGMSTLDVVARHPDRFEVFALTAHRSIDRLADQCRQFRPAVAVVGDATAAHDLRQRLAREHIPTEVQHGPAALEAVAGAPEVHAVMAAIVGAAGLPSALAAARSGKRVLLANKEALVMAGPVFLQAVRDGGARLLPIDSEHNAIFQCLPVDYAANPDRHGVRRLMLTASGGPFRASAPHELEAVTPEQACKHPNWVMGRKISVDSASMMNKGLELIEAHLLFGVPAERIEVVIHPESVIHSLVEYVDGSVLAQLGNPDMRTPIANALAFPERIASGVASLDLPALARMHFEKPDLDRFPCLQFAYDALAAGGAAPAMLNAANEVAVDAFLHRNIGFRDIPRCIDDTLQRLPASAAATLDDVLAADALARQAAQAFVMRRAA